MTVSTNEHHFISLHSGVLSADAAAAIKFSDTFYLAVYPEMNDIIELTDMWAYRPFVAINCLVFLRS